MLNAHVRHYCRAGFGGIGLLALKDVALDESVCQML